MQRRRILSNCRWDIRRQYIEPTTDLLVLQGNSGNENNDVAGDARILFSSCKSESHTHKTGFKQLYRRVRASGYKPDKLDSKEDFTTDFLRDAAVLVLGCPKERFTASEFEVLKRFVHSGGSLLVLLNEGGEEKAGTNINYLLEEFGISVNNDAVVRTTHYKYLHPKEVSYARSSPVRKWVWGHCLHTYKDHLN